MSERTILVEMILAGFLCCRLHSRFRADGDWQAIFWQFASPPGAYGEAAPLPMAVVLHDRAAFGDTASNGRADRA